MKRKSPSFKKTDTGASTLMPPIKKTKKIKVLAPEVLPAADEDTSHHKSENDPSEFDPENHFNEDFQENESEDADSDPSENPSEAEIDSNRLLPQAHNIDKEVSAIVPAVTSSDPLKRYLDELKRYPLLEPQEEFTLAMQLREEGNLTQAQTAARMLVTANLRLVVKIAFEYRTFYSNLLDLIQEGNIGLMKAVSKFDPTKGARLSYYASWWIRSYILKYLLDNFRLVKIGTTQAQKKLFYHLMREKEKLETQGLLAGPKLLAERLNVREKDVVEMEQRLSGQGAEMSLDAPLDRSEGNPKSHIDLLSDDRETADEALARDQILQLLRDNLPHFQKLLNEKELKILNDRLLAEEPKTLQEVADLYGLTRERARQIETKVIDKLRDFLKPALEK